MNQGKGAILPLGRSATRSTASASSTPRANQWPPKLKGAKVGSSSRRSTSRVIASARSGR